MGEFFFLRSATFPSREIIFDLSIASRLKILTLFGSQATLPCTYYAPGIYPETGNLTFLGKGKGTLHLCFLCKTLHTKQHSAPLTHCGTHSSPVNTATFPGLAHAIRTTSSPGAEPQWATAALQSVRHSDSTPAISVLTPEVSFNKGQTRVFQKCLEDFCRKSVCLASADTWLPAASSEAKQAHTC